MVIPELLLIDKPAGWTSFDVVAKIRSAIRASYTRKGEKPTKRQLKVGHTGTLDPFATGLLIVLLDDATKRSDEFLKLDKVYDATIRLGAHSTTGDPEGEITEQAGQVPTSADIVEVLAQFTGEITQIPPQYSAIKVGGVKAYEAARRGKVVEIPPRLVTIYALELVDYTYPVLRIRTHVSSGTYIRTLAEDIGARLGSAAYCEQLRRTRIADYSVADAATVDETVAALASL